MRPHHLSLLGLLTCAAAVQAQVRPGIDVLLADSAHLIARKRVGLLTNQTGLDARGRRDVDRLLAGGYRLTTLFSPEHGFKGLEDRPGLPDATDSATGVPIYSLYGSGTRTGRAALDSLDVVLIDLQDIGARYYTYPATATQLMREAARRGTRVIVLDRPNPVGGAVIQGNVRAVPGDPDSDFVGFLPVPMRHGMTLGELLLLANDTLRLGATVTVVPAAGWRRIQYYDATGLAWVRPSPNLPDLESALHYPGTCLFEGTNLSVGRGTAHAFQVIGAPWLDTGTVLAQLRGANGAGPGVAITGTVFTPHAPTDGKYGGVALGGLRLRVTDRRRYDPTRAAVALLAAIRAAHPAALRFDARQFDRLAGSADLRTAILAGHSARTIARAWEPALARFRHARAKYLIYAEPAAAIRP